MSSWRQRLGLVNGFRLYALAPGEAHYNDADLSTSITTLAWLSELSTIPVDQLALLTLRHFDGRLLHFGAGRAAPRWVIPLHYSRRDRPFATQYCPRCLAEDEQPYFRLHWRLALATSCERHSTLLLEGCPKCGLPVWPVPSTIPSLYRDQKCQGLQFCPVCSFDISHATTMVVTNQAHRLISLENIEPQVFITRDLKVPTVEFSATFWTLCQLFLKARPSRRIASQPTNEGRLAELLARHDVRSLEQLPVAARHALTSHAAEIFQSWPVDFIHFCESHGITSEHFSDARQDLPGWFLSQVNGNLAKQRRYITVVDVDTVRNALVSQGVKVTKAALGRKLGSRYAKAVIDIATSRCQATAQERLDFLRRLDAYASKSTSRRSSSEMRLRNAVILLLAIGKQMHLKNAVCLNQNEVYQHVDELKLAGERDRHAKRVANLLLKLVTRYEKRRSQRSEKRPLSIGDLFFENFRGGKVSSRPAQSALNQCMVGADDSLQRSVATFWC